MESGDFDSRGAIRGSEGAMTLTEPSGTTMSGRPVRRRPRPRHGATTNSLGTGDRLPNGESVPPLSRRQVTACRRRVPSRGKTPEGLDSAWTV
jgi:hypothetical protein